MSSPSTCAPPSSASGETTTVKKVTLSPQCNPVEMPVPISHPRYEFKTRLNRTLTVQQTTTDQSDQESTAGRSGGGRSQPSDYLTMRSEASLKVRQGPVTHTEKITYHAYACYRHGSKQVHTQSIGYSSDADLVLHRRDVVADTASVHSAVEAALCLKPGAHPDTYNVDPGVDLADAKLRRKLRRLQKYPGVRCPKNRKIRNRLLNDHFATPAARRLYEAAHEDSDPEGLKQPAQAAFEPMPVDVVQWMLHQEETVMHTNLQRLGLELDPCNAGVIRHSSRKQRAPAALDSAAFRFAQLPARLKAELQHALTTDFMPGFIDDVESRVQNLIVADAEFRATAEAGDHRELPPTSLDLACKDGYGRLLAHGVALYYKVASQSTTLPDGQRVTTISLPRKRVPLPDQSLLSFLRGDRLAESSDDLEPCSAPAAPGGVDSGREEERTQARLLLRRRRFKKRVIVRRLTNASATATGGLPL